MKRSISILSVLAFVLAFSGSVYGQSESVNITADVLTSITLGSPTPVQFGNLDPNSSPVIDPDGSEQFQDIVNGGQIGILPITSAANNTQLIIDWNQTAVTLGDGGSETITFNPDIMANNTNDASTSSEVTKNTADASTETSGSGELWIYIGGDLGTLSNQAQGSYSSDASNGSGDLEFTVSYL